jgi:CheY-like chemotaxis protein
MMGGRIWLESQPGRGSVFYFTVRLPLARELPPERETPGALVAAASKLRILLVEDNPANQKLAGYILRERGHTVDIAGNGEEGLRMALKYEHDIILMDVQMPGMDGLQATEAIRKQEQEDLRRRVQRSEEGEQQARLPSTPQRLTPVRRVPIIAMTAHAMQGDRDRCLAGGMDGYLSKPINGAEMIALVEKLAAGANPMKCPLVPAQPASAPPPAVFDLQSVLMRCCNDPHILAEMVQCYFDEVALLLPQMRAALDGNDLVEFGRLGHRLKGTVVYLGAEPATAAAMRVEHFGQCGGTRAEAEEVLGTLKRECNALKAAISEHRIAASLK